MRLAVKRISLICLSLFSMFLFTACGERFESTDHPENISSDIKEKIYNDIPAGNIKNVNISGNARSIIIEQGVTDNFEFFNADLDKDNQYEVTCDEDGNDLNIIVMMENAEASNNILGSVVVSIPKKEFEKIETTGEFKQVHLNALNSDVFIHAYSSSVGMELMSDQLDHNITLMGSELNPFREVSILFDKLPENIKIELNNIPQNAIDDLDGLLTGDKLELGSGKPIISISNSDKLDLYVE